MTALRGAVIFGVGLIVFIAAMAAFFLVALPWVGTGLT